MGTDDVMRILTGPPRLGDVDYFICSTERMWPPDIISDASHPMIAAIRETLERVPDDVFEVVEERVAFVVDDQVHRGVNVPVSSSPEPAFVVVIMSLWKKIKSPKSRVGLVAHELAHCFVKGKDYAEDEALADALVREWGFGEELDTLRVENGAA